MMAVDGAPDLTWVGPVVTGIATVLVAVVSGFALVVRRRQDRKDALEDKQDDAERELQLKPIDGYEEVRKARAEATTYYNLYRAFEDLYYTVASALRHLARRVRDQHPEQEFEKDIVDALALKPPETSTKKPS